MFTKKYCGILILVLTLLVLTTAIQAFDPVEELGDVDFEGATVTYMCYYDPFLDFQEDGIYPGRLEAAKDKFNIGEIRLLEVPWGDDLVDTAMSRLMGGDAEHDVWFFPNPFIWSMAAQGAFYPLNRILPEEFYEGLPAYMSEIFNEITIDGERFAFGLANDTFELVHFMVWNKDLFEREGLTPADELYLNDEWTWEAMEEIAIQATRDTTGDGEIDQYGLGSVDIIHMVLANDGEIIVRDEDGNYIFTMHESEEALFALEKIHEWSQILEIMSGTWDLREFIDGTRAMARAEMWQLSNIKENLEDDWGVVPLPRGPHAEEYRYPVNNIDTVFISASAEKPEGLVALTHFLWPADEFIQQREEELTELVPDRTSFEVYMRGREDFTSDSAFFLEGVIGPAWDTGYLFGQTLSSIAWGGEDASSELNAVQPAIQTQLNDFFGH